MSTEVRVPTLGESVTEATIGQWFKKVGDAVAADGLESNREGWSGIVAIMPKGGRFPRRAGGCRVRGRPPAPRRGRAAHRAAPARGARDRRPRRPRNARIGHRGRPCGGQAGRHGTCVPAGGATRHCRETGRLFLAPAVGSGSIGRHRVYDVAIHRGTGISCRERFLRREAGRIRSVHSLCRHWLGSAVEREGAGAISRAVGT